MQIILKDGTYFQPDQEFISEMQRFYPNININKELTKIAAWNYSNESRRKTKRGIKKHINSWLCKANESVPERPKQPIVTNKLKDGFFILRRMGEDAFQKWVHKNQINKYDQECIVNAVNGIAKRAENLTKDMFQSV